MSEVINKTMIVEKVAALLDDSELSLPQIEAVINATLSAIVKDVAAGNKVAFQNFGSLEPRERKAREGRNPKTNEKIQIPATVVPVFKAGKAFKEAVAPKNS